VEPWLKLNIMAEVRGKVVQKARKRARMSTKETLSPFWTTGIM